MTIEQELIRDLGLTEDPFLAVWMTRDGLLVNGSIEGRQRDIDHHEIGQYFKASKFQDPGSSAIYVRKFMRRGNIRMGFSDCGLCFEFETPPSEAQVKTLAPWIQEGLDGRVEICAARHGVHGIKYENAWQIAAYFKRYLGMEIVSSY